MLKFSHPWWSFCAHRRRPPSRFGKLPDYAVSLLFRGLQVPRFCHRSPEVFRSLLAETNGDEFQQRHAIRRQRGREVEGAEGELERCLPLRLKVSTQRSAALPPSATSRLPPRHPSRSTLTTQKESTPVQCKRWRRSRTRSRPS